MKMNGVCPICESEHEIELIKLGSDGEIAWADYFCPISRETWTHIDPPEKRFRWTPLLWKWFKDHFGLGARQ